MKGDNIEIRDGFLISKEEVEAINDGALVAFYASKYSRLYSDVRNLFMMVRGFSNNMLESDNWFVNEIANYIRDSKKKGGE